MKQMTKKCRICQQTGCDPSEHRLIRFIADRPRGFKEVIDDCTTN